MSSIDCWQTRFSADRHFQRKFQETETIDHAWRLQQPNTRTAVRGPNDLGPAIPAGMSGKGSACLHPDGVRDLSGLIHLSQVPSNIPDTLQRIVVIAFRDKNNPINRVDE